MSKLWNPIIDAYVKNGDIVLNRMGKAYIVVDNEPKNGLIWVMTRDERKVHSQFLASNFGLEVQE